MKHQLNVINAEAIILLIMVQDRCKACGYTRDVVYFTVENDEEIGWTYNGQRIAKDKWTGLRENNEV